MVTIYHPPYSRDVALCDFFLFPKMELYLKGHCFEAIEDMQAEGGLNAYAANFQKMHGIMEKGGIAVSMPKGTISKESVETRKMVSMETSMENYKHF